jgi:flagellar M-ring protein FliF
VVDSNGNVLSTRQGTSEEALTGNQLELRSKTEKELSAKVHSILEPVVGPGKVRADASVVMDFSRSEQTEETYDPQTTAIRSQQRTEDRSEPSTTPAAGVPGTQSNDSNQNPAFIPIGRAANTSVRQSESTNFEISRTTRHTLLPAGEIRRVSLAVIVDDAVRTETGADGTTTSRTEPRSAEELKKIRDLVSAAIGIDANRGDMLTVENISFNVPWDSDVSQDPTFVERWRDLLQPALKYGALLTLFVLAYLLLFRPVSKVMVQQLSQPQPSVELAAAAGAAGLDTPKTVKELEAQLGEGGGTALMPAQDVRKADILKQRVAELVRRDPEASAQLVRAWLSEKSK